MLDTDIEIEVIKHKENDMRGFDLVINTLELIKALHEKPSFQGSSEHDDRLIKEEVVLAPKTLEQLELALLEARKLSFSPRSKPKFAKSNVYEGISQGEMAWEVLKNGDLFDPKPSLAVNNHSPDGFSWGYAGSGPAQLALAILMEEFSLDFARENYNAFMRDVICGLDMGNAFTLTSDSVRTWVNNHVESQEAVSEVSE